MSTTHPVESVANGGAAAAGLDVRNVSHRFGAVVALEDVSLEVRPGRVTCLLGENGAGKSTLIRILSGVFPPLSGYVLLDGRRVVLSSPREARALGIATVYQDLALAPLLSVWRNFVLGAEPTIGRGPLRRLDVRSAQASVRQELDRMAIDVHDLSTPAGRLSGGQRQAIAIARAIHFGARILILDEPTAALAVRQAERVLETIAAARERGAAVLLVTHNPSHAFEAGDEFVILKHGRIATRLSRAGLALEDLVSEMTGT